MNDFYILNYVVVFFLISISMIFYFLTINKIIIARDDFHETLNLSNVICIKIDFNGIILNYSENFIDLISNDNSVTDIQGYEFLKTINFTNDDTKDFMDFINRLENQNNASAILSINVRGTDKSVLIKGKTTKNISGISEKFIFTLIDITEKVELQENIIEKKEANRSLNADLSSIEEELQRTFEQLNEKSKDIVNVMEKHKLVVNSLDIGIFEYDFNRREIYFSNKFVEQILGVNREKISEEDVLNYLKSNLSLIDYTNLLTTFYKALFNHEDNFSTSFYIKNIDKTIVLNGTIYFNDEDPIYFVCYSEIWEN